FRANDAYTLCSRLIYRASRDPEKVVIPRIPAAENAEAFTFVWSANSQLVRVRNGLGLEVGTTAHCVVSKQEKQVRMFAFDGKMMPII
ncbi:hypothetical protein, partial [Comamonas sp.]|uniref:hypothetical protein n=1 Tax=Comamonas sp. TaxID=34028 RepID=UPI00258B08DB